MIIVKDKPFNEIRDMIIKLTPANSEARKDLIDRIFTIERILDTIEFGKTQTKSEEIKT